jgi:hypothetical protein
MGVHLSTPEQAGAQDIAVYLPAISTESVHRNA